MFRTCVWMLIVLTFQTVSVRAQPPKNTLPSKLPLKPQTSKPPVGRHVSNLYGRALANSPSMLSSDASQAVWRVFFATNRVRLASDQGQPISYGPVWASPPRLEYGECEVVIPMLRELENAAAAKGSRKGARSSASTGAASTGTGTGCRKVEPTPYNQFFEELVRAVAQSPQHDVLVFVPGYNTRFEEAVCRAGQLAAELPFNGVVICYSWPSAGTKLAYAQDVEQAEWTVRHLWRFLSALHNHLGRGTRINLVAHGMGCRALMQSIAALPKNIRDARPFQHLVLASPDLGYDEFPPLADKCTAASRHVTLYVSRGDEALVATRKLAKTAQRAGDASKLTIVPGVDTIDVTLVDPSFLGHAYQAGDRTVLNELFQLIKLDDPPAQRQWLRETKSDGKTYWQFVDRPPQAIQAERPTNKK